MIKVAQLPSMIEIVFKREVYRIRLSRALELIQRLLVAADRSIGKKKWEERSIWLSSKS